MRQLSNTEAELKKALLFKKACSSFCIQDPAELLAIPCITDSTVLGLALNLIQTLTLTGGQCSSGTIVWIPIKGNTDKIQSFPHNAKYRTHF